MENAKNETITIKKEALWKYSTFVLAAVVVIMAFILFFGNGNPTTTGQVINNPLPPVPSQPTEPSKVQASEDDDAILGNKNAKVTIIEFSDYQCPFCERFWSQTLPQIKSQYIDTGKVKFVYRDFPLESIHPMALSAAMAAECVGEQGGDTGYFKMHDKIFENQGSLSAENLKKWAKELGYNIDTCLDSGKTRAEVQKDTQDAQSAGGRGTPYFVINGVPISGAVPFDNFRQVIETELAK
ncbi:DsbA family protein [Candidatus Pacearchaeota archaeon]|nr:DsbA family protein [Candidatus Pacearchaeota archaeon]